MLDMSTTFYVMSDMSTTFYVMLDMSTTFYVRHVYYILCYFRHVYYILCYVRHVYYILCHVRHVYYNMSKQRSLSNKKYAVFFLNKQSKISEIKKRRTWFFLIEVKVFFLKFSVVNILSFSKNEIKN